MPLFKKFLWLFFLIVFCFILAGVTRAAGEFETDFDLKYEVKSNGVTTVTQNVRLTNKVADIYAKEYHFSIGSTRIQNITAQDGLGPIDAQVTKTNNSTEINLFFNERVVGKDETLNFSLYFESLDFASKNGQVWEVAIPKMSKTLDIKSYQLELITPISFGEPAYMLPNYFKKETRDGKTSYSFHKEAVQEQGIAAAFGSHQIFDFTLNYHLKNPRKEIIKTEIALPPETAYQRLFYQEITPAPEEVIIDEDGNWLATYYLKPESLIEVTAKGSVELFIKPRKEFPKTKIDKDKYLKPQKYWEVDNPEVQKLAKELKTPSAIYNFVVENLIYDYGRIKQPLGRSGALEALNNKASAICTEFTDLFIALARAAGIPAREANGYAYTNNPSLRPLSLKEDILHAWPEYYDEALSLWRPVDPTWGKTTGGVDFFSKLDLNHFVFTFHGIDSTYPYPAGSYKTDEIQDKDIHVQFGSLPQENLKLALDSHLPKNIFGGFSFNSSLVLQNQSNFTLIDENGTVSATSGLRLNEADFSLDIFPPFAKHEIVLKFKPISLLKSSEEKIEVSFAGQTLEKTIKTQPIFLLPLGFLSLPLITGLVIGIFMVKLAQWIVKRFLR